MRHYDNNNNSHYCHYAINEIVTRNSSSSISLLTWLMGQESWNVIKEIFYRMVIINERFWSFSRTDGNS